MASAPSPLFVKVSLPSGLEECLEDLTLEVLRKKPVNLKIFAQQHFERRVRESGGCSCTRAAKESPSTKRKRPGLKPSRRDASDSLSRRPKDKAGHGSSAENLSASKDGRGGPGRPGAAQFGRTFPKRGGRDAALGFGGPTAIPIEPPPKPARTLGRERIIPIELEEEKETKKAESPMSLGTMMAFGAGAVAAAGAAGAVGYVVGDSMLGDAGEEGELKQAADDSGEPGPPEEYIQEADTEENGEEPGADTEGGEGPDAAAEPADESPEQDEEAQDEPAPEEDEPVADDEPPTEVDAEAFESAEAENAELTSAEPATSDGENVEEPKTDEPDAEANAEPAEPAEEADVEPGDEAVDADNGELTLAEPAAEDGQNVEEPDEASAGEPEAEADAEPTEEAEAELGDEVAGADDAPPDEVELEAMADTEPDAAEEVAGEDAMEEGEAEPGAEEIDAEAVAEAVEAEAAADEEGDAEPAEATPEEVGADVEEAGAEADPEETDIGPGDDEVEAVAGEPDEVALENDNADKETQPDAEALLGKNAEDKEDDGDGTNDDPTGADEGDANPDELESMQEFAALLDQESKDEIPAADEMEEDAENTPEEEPQVEAEEAVADEEAPEADAVAVLAADELDLMEGDGEATADETLPENEPAAADEDGGNIPDGLEEPAFEDSGDAMAADEQVEEAEEQAVLEGSLVAEEEGLSEPELGKAPEENGMMAEVEEGETEMAEEQSAVAELEGENTDAATQLEDGDTAADEEPVAADLLEEAPSADGDLESDVAEALGTEPSAEEEASAMENDAEEILEMEGSSTHDENGDPAGEDGTGEAPDTTEAAADELPEAVDEEEAELAHLASDPGEGDETQEDGSSVLAADGEQAEDAALLAEDEAPTEVAEPVGEEAANDEGGPGDDGPADGISPDKHEEEAEPAAETEEAVNADAGAEEVVDDATVEPLADVAYTEPEPAEESAEMVLLDEALAGEDVADEEPPLAITEDDAPAADDADAVEETTGDQGEEPAPVEEDAPLEAVDQGEEAEDSPPAVVKEEEPAVGADDSEEAVAPSLSGEVAEGDDEEPAAVEGDDEGTVPDNPAAEEEPDGEAILDGEEEAADGDVLPPAALEEEAEPEQEIIATENETEGEPAAAGELVAEEVPDESSSPPPAGEDDAGQEAADENPEEPNAADAPDLAENEEPGEAAPLEDPAEADGDEQPEPTADEEGEPINTELGEAPAANDEEGNEAGTDPPLENGTADADDVAEEGVKEEKEEEPAPVTEDPVADDGTELNHDPHHAPVLSAPIRTDDDEENVAELTAPADGTAPVASTVDVAEDTASGSLINVDDAASNDNQQVQNETSLDEDPSPEGIDAAGAEDMLDGNDEGPMITEAPSSEVLQGHASANEEGPIDEQSLSQTPETAEPGEESVQTAEGSPPVEVDASSRVIDGEDMGNLFSRFKGPCESSREDEETVVIGGDDETTDDLLGLSESPTVEVQPTSTHPPSPAKSEGRESSKAKDDNEGRHDDEDDPGLFVNDEVSVYEVDVAGYTRDHASADALEMEEAVIKSPSRSNVELAIHVPSGVDSMESEMGEEAEQAVPLLASRDEVVIEGDDRAEAEPSKGTGAEDNDDEDREYFAASAEEALNAEQDQVDEREGRVEEEKPTTVDTGTNHDESSEAEVREMASGPAADTVEAISPPALDYVLTVHDQPLDLTLTRGYEEEPALPDDKAIIETADDGGTLTMAVVSITEDGPVTDHEYQEPIIGHSLEEEEAAIKIQSHFKGYLARKGVNIPAGELATSPALLPLGVVVGDDVEQEEAGDGANGSLTTVEHDTSDATSHPAPAISEPAIEAQLILVDVEKHPGLIEDLGSSPEVAVDVGGSPNECIGDESAISDASPGKAKGADTDGFDGLQLVERAETTPPSPMLLELEVLGGPSETPQGDEQAGPNNEIGEFGGSIDVADGQKLLLERSASASDSGIVMALSCEPPSDGIDLSADDAQSLSVAHQLADDSGWEDVEAAATKIQARYRGYRARRHLVHQAPLAGERGAVGFEDEQAPRLTHPSTTVEDEEDSILLEKAAVKIQASARGYLARKKLKKERRPPSADELELERAAAKIQAGVRGYLTRRRYKRKATSLETQQQHEREEAPTDTPVAGMACDGDDTKMHAGDEEAAAAKIQAGVRGHLTRKRLREQQRAEALAATKIQARFRGYTTRKQLQSLTYEIDDPDTGTERRDECVLRVHVPAADRLVDAGCDASGGFLELHFSFNFSITAQFVGKPFQRRRTRRGFKGGFTDREQKMEDLDDVAGEASRTPTASAVVDDNGRASEAATKIQSRFRGYKTRKTMDLRRRHQLNRRTRDQDQLLIADDEDHLMGLPLTGTEQEAATKIQARYRGYRARRELQSKSNDMQLAPTDESPVLISLLDAHGSMSCLSGAPDQRTNEEISVNVGQHAAKDEEATPSITLLGSLETSTCDSGQITYLGTDGQAIDTATIGNETALEYDEEAERAAARIQAQYRGFKTRQELRVSKSPVPPISEAEPDLLLCQAAAGEGADGQFDSFPAAGDDEGEAPHHPLLLLPAEELGEDAGDLEQAAIKIQAQFRGYMARKEVREGSKSPIPRSPLTMDATPALADSTLPEPPPVLSVDGIEVTINNPSMSNQANVGDEEAPCSPSPSVSDGGMSEDDSGELEQAAIKIQSQFRGYKVRKATRAGSRSPIPGLLEAEDEGKLLQPSPAITLAEAEVEETLMVEESNRLDDRDQQERAAVKIQAQYRGFRARSELRASSKSPVPSGNADIQDGVKDDTAAAADRLSGELVGGLTSTAAALIDADGSDSQVWSATTLGDEEEKAAVKIQAQYRGFKVRKTLGVSSASEWPPSAQGQEITSDTAEDDGEHQEPTRT